MPHACHVLSARPASVGPHRSRLRSSGRRSRSRSLLPPLATLALLLALFLTLAPAVLAAPAGPTMDLAQLGTALGSGPLDGYLLTTMSGTAPETIPLQVQSLVTYSDGTLILFEASGPVIDRLGAIAAGMSGSPVYVTVGGVDYLVGALSYGDMFTRGGTGLATPIEYMTAIETTYPVATLGAHTAAAPQPGEYALSAPVKTQSGEVRHVVIARSVAAGRKLAATTEQPVVAPLGIIEIGGARPGSAAYDRVAAKFARTGMLIKPASGDGTWAGAPAPSLTAGSPCAVLFSAGRDLGRRGGNGDVRGRQHRHALRAPVRSVRRDGVAAHRRVRGGLVAEQLRALQAHRAAGRQGTVRAGPRLGRQRPRSAGPPRSSPYTRRSTSPAARSTTLRPSSSGSSPRRPTRACPRRSHLSSPSGWRTRPCSRALRRPPRPWSSRTAPGPTP